MTAALATLNSAALVALASCEQRIERGLKTFIDVGQALAEIRDSRLYKGTHDTFEAYLEGRWGMSRAHAYRMISAAEVVSPMGDIEDAPTNERQTRELAKVPESERAEVWREAVERTDGKPTAAAVREVAAERAETPGPAAAPSTAPAGPGSAPAPAADAPMPPQEPDPDPKGERFQFTCFGCGKPFIAAMDENRCPKCGGSGTNCKPLNPEPKPNLRIVPDAEQVQADERRDARAHLRRIVDLAWSPNWPDGHVEVWAKQLGPYDEELADLTRRALKVIAVLDELVEAAGVER